MNAEDTTPESEDESSILPTDDELMQSVAEIMSSGMPQKGAKYTLPESMMLALLKRTYMDGYGAKMHISLAFLEAKLNAAYMAGFVDGKGTAERAQ